MKSQNKLWFFIVSLFLFFSGIPEHGTNICKQMLPSGFVSDGRCYQVKFSSNEPAKAYLSFFNGYTYHIAFCSTSVKKYKIELYDIEKKLLFSGNCENYSLSWDLAFQASLSCFAVISPEETIKKEETLAISIGFKELKTAKK